MSEIASIMTPEVQAAISGFILVGLGYLTVKLRNLAQHEETWKKEETGQSTPVVSEPETRTAVLPVEPADGQSAAAYQAVVESIPKGSTIQKIVDATTSDGQKVRVIYFKTPLVIG